MNDIVDGLDGAQRISRALAVQETHSHHFDIGGAPRHSDGAAAVGGGRDNPGHVGAVPVKVHRVSAQRLRPGGIQAVVVVDDAVGIVILAVAGDLSAIDPYA